MIQNIRKKIALSALIILPLILAAAAVSWYCHDNYKTLYHFRTVDEGKIYRSGCLKPEGWEKLHARTGFKTIVNLRSVEERTKENDSKGDWYNNEKNFAASKNITLVDIPMQTDTPPTPEQVKEFLGIVTDKAKLPVLIHCEAGVIRTGMMVAVYRIAVLNEPNGKVLAELPMFGHGFDNRIAVKEFILTYEPEKNINPKN